MLSIGKITGGQARDYFEHERAYYTEHMTCRDRWHGSFAAALNLEGELSKEQFDAVFDVENNYNKTVGVDLTFSCPKSVSLASALDDETRETILVCHQRAVASVMKRIEAECAFTRVTENGHTRRVHTNNILAAEFTHMVARPCSANEFKSDLDVHSHVVLKNKTVYNGRVYALDLSPFIGDRAETVAKEYGLEFRAQLAQELIKEGFELEITDPKQGFWELAGFDRETILEYSHRRLEIENAMEERGISAAAANKLTRATKSQGHETERDITLSTRKDLFESGKIKLRRNKHGKRIEGSKVKGIDRAKNLKGREINSRSSDRTVERSGPENYETWRPKAGCRDITTDGGRERIELRSADSLCRLRELSVAETRPRPDMLLSQSELNRLAEQSIGHLEDLYLRRPGSVGSYRERADRLNAIQKITEDTLEQLAREEYAFSVKKAVKRIKAAGVLYAVSTEEAQRAIEAAEGVVKLGQSTKKKSDKNVYLTLENNIEKGEAIVERIKNGKGVITDKILTMDESRALLNKVENAHNDPIIKRGGKLLEDYFYISGSGGQQGVGGEQGEAIHHLLTCKDRYVCWNGLAG